MVRESSYYRNLAIWLERKGYYVGRSKPKTYSTNDLFIRRGMKKAQVDVAGIKNFGKSFFDEIEIAVIEVKYSKVGRQITLQDLEQTRGYYTYAHVCYLAFTENMEISADRVEDARCRNIGLLRVPMDFYSKTPNQIKTEDLELIHSPSRQVPSSESETLEFLGKLDILRCTLCGCYFINEGCEEIFPSLPPQGASFKRLERNKVFELFPDQIDYGWDTRHRHYKKKMWKHLCILCIEDLAKLYGIEKMKNDIATLRKDIDKLKDKE